MRTALRFSGLVLALAAAGCNDIGDVFPPDVPAPTNLVYVLEPSGDPDQPDRPAGILLAWDAVSAPDLASYRIYSRGSSAGAWGLRGETTSNTFHDNGEPHLQYFVVSVDLDGGESGGSNVITVDERLQLERPASLFSISLDQAIHLQWTDNAFSSDPSRFQWYRIYSVAYDLDLGLCETDWVLEGTTVAPEFLVGAMPNGMPRCFGVSAVSVEGYESLWSPLRQDTPRPDAHNILMFAYDELVTESGFRFWQDANGDGLAQRAELGLVMDGDRTDIDFWIFRDPTDSTLWFVPEFSGTRMQVYGSMPVAALSDIDFAPASGYGRNMVQAVPGYGYVFEIVDGTRLHYASLRVSHAGRDYVIFDFAFQTDPGNPELVAPRD